MIAGVRERVVITIFAAYALSHLGLGIAVAARERGLLAGLETAELALFAVAIVALALPTGGHRLGVLRSSITVVATLALALLMGVGLQLGAEVAPGRGWYVGAIGSASAMLALRGRGLAAAICGAALAVQVLVLVGPTAFAQWGVPVALVWIAVVVILVRAIDTVNREAAAARNAAAATIAWQASREAVDGERQDRIAQTMMTALPMLERIVTSHGRLTDAQREDCRHLEAALRDEIRGRMLLDDEVRAQVLLARRRGAEVSLLDDGGLDELSSADLTRVRRRIALDLAGSRAERLVVRTLGADSPIAVTVVGLTGDEHGESDVELWREIPRGAGMRSHLDAAEADVDGSAPDGSDADRSASA